MSGGMTTRPSHVHQPLFNQAMNMLTQAADSQRIGKINKCISVLFVS